MLTTWKASPTCLQCGGSRLRKGPALSSRNFKRNKEVSFSMDKCMDRSFDVSVRE